MTFCCICMKLYGLGGCFFDYLYEEWGQQLYMLAWSHYSPMITNRHHYITFISCCEVIKCCFCLCYVCGLGTLWDDKPKANVLSLKQLPNGNQMMIQKDILLSFIHFTKSQLFFTKVGVAYHYFL